MTEEPYVTMGGLLTVCLVGRLGRSVGGGGGGGLLPVVECGGGIMGFPPLCWFKAAMRAWRDVNWGSLTSAIVFVCRI